MDEIIIKKYLIKQIEELTNKIIFCNSPNEINAYIFLSGQLSNILNNLSELLKGENN